MHADYTIFHKIQPLLHLHTLTLTSQEHFSDIIIIFIITIINVIILRCTRFVWVYYETAPLSRRGDDNGGGWGRTVDSCCERKHKQ